MPKPGPEAYKTYQIFAPLSTHFVPATCAEVDCPRYLNGWRTTLDPTNADHEWLCEWIRKRSKRKFEEFRRPDGLVEFTFASGQECFAKAERRPHMRRLDRPEHFLVRDGDNRGNPFGTRARLHQRPEHWVEDFAEHQDRLARVQQRG